MYPRQHTQSDAAQLDLRSSVSDQDREGFRPVALPALAAAVQVAASAAREAARKIAARPVNSRFQHEDSPLV